MSFYAYNMKAHNQSLGYVRTMRVNRRNALIVAQLEAFDAELPTERVALYAVVKTHEGKLPWSVLQRLARQVRAAKETK